MGLRGRTGNTRDRGSVAPRRPPQPRRSPLKIRCPLPWRRRHPAPQLTPPRVNPSRPASTTTNHPGRSWSSPTSYEARMPPPLGGPVRLRRSSGRRTTTCRCSPRCAAATVTDAPPTGCCQPNPSLPQTLAAAWDGWMVVQRKEACVRNRVREGGSGTRTTTAGTYSTSHLMAASSPLRAMAAVGLFFDAMVLGIGDEVEVCEDQGANIKVCSPPRTNRSRETRNLDRRTCLKFKVGCSMYMELRFLSIFLPLHVMAAFKDSTTCVKLGM